MRLSTCLIPLLPALNALSITQISREEVTARNLTAMQYDGGFIQNE